jgi:hypothetical protein
MRGFVGISNSNEKNQAHELIKKIRLRNDAPPLTWVI